MSSRSTPSNGGRPTDEPVAAGTALRFPAGFLWGAATSAWQIEGSPLADGAGPSNWTRFAQAPQRAPLGQVSEVACDHYRRWREDVALMRRLGLKAYRFSISWSRVLPTGAAESINRPGLDFYARLVDALLEAGIQPCATLFHWDLPAALDERGGWVNRDSAHWFADYARVMYRALGDRVPMWATLNEPWVVMDAGYLHGTHAPGHHSVAEAPVVAHNLLRAHGEAVRAYRAEANQRIGLVVNLEPKDPATNAPADLAATQRADAYMNRYFLDAVFRGSYPDELRAVFGAHWPQFPSDDFEVIGQRLDWLGINYYSRGFTAADDSRPPVGARTVPVPGAQYTELNWEVHPASFRRVLNWVHERYGPIPLYVTENGAAFADSPTVTGEVLEDPRRKAYLLQHLAAARQALADGVDLRGYFVWSLLDNVEWAEGTSKRFGVVHVDFATQKRTIKRSGMFYAGVIRGTI